MKLTISVEETKEIIAQHYSLRPCDVVVEGFGSTPTAELVKQRLKLATIKALRAEYDLTLFDAKQIADILIRD